MRKRMKSTGITHHAIKRFAERGLAYVDALTREQQLFIRKLLRQELRSRPMVDWLGAGDVKIADYAVRLVVRDHVVVTVKYIGSEKEKR